VSAFKILLVDINADNRLLLTRTLRRKFPLAQVVEVEETGLVVERAASRAFDLIILHRTNGDEAVDLVKAIREVAPKVPILVMSGIDRSEVVLRAGATDFLNFNEWLRIGEVVKNVVSVSAASEIN
jgi:CheY-like chemotaxis protein